MGRPRLTLLFAAVVLVCALGCEPAAERPGEPPAPPAPGALARADSLVAAWVDEGRVPGAVLSVYVAGRPVLERPYGWAVRYGYEGVGPPTTVADPTVMTQSTAFDLASVTKVMATTFALMLLVDEGAMDLDAPVWTHLPDFTGGGKDAITVRHLLTHTGGLQQWVPTYYHADAADEAYAYIRMLPLGWPAGEGRHYSDLGFMLLGRIVEQVSGLPLDDFLQERLYGPMGLERTGFRRADRGNPAPGRGNPEPGRGNPEPGRGNPATGRGPPEPDRAVAATSHGNPFEFRMVHDTAFGYRIEEDPTAWDGWRRRTLVGEVNDGNAWHAFGGVAGHAGLFSTAAELQALLRILLDGGVVDGRRWLSAEVVDAFLAPSSGTAAGQALGWQVPADAPAGSVHHTGFTGTYVLAVPALRLGVVLLTNRQHGGVDGNTRYPDVGPLQAGVRAALLARTSG